MRLEEGGDNMKLVGSNKLLHDLKDILVRQSKVTFISLLLILATNYTMYIVDLSPSVETAVYILMISVILKLIIVPSDLVKIHTNYSSEMRRHKQR